MNENISIYSEEEATVKTMIKLTYSKSMSHGLWYLI